MQEEIWYKTVKNFGFKEKNIMDSAYFDQYGYPYKIISLKLSKTLYIDWDQTTRTCELIRQNKECDILARMPIKDLAHLEEIIEFFKGKDTFSKYRAC
jgi:hypothetical protein